MSRQHVIDTIGRATRYQPMVQLNGHARPAENIATTPRRAPVQLNLRELARREPQPPAFIVPGWLPQGMVTLLAGHGGTGKSAQSLHLACCLSLGRPWHGIDLQRRRVAVFSFEDGIDALHWRLSRIALRMGVDLADIAAGLDVFDGTAADAVMFGDGRDGMLTTNAYEWIADAIRQCRAEVIVIDGSSDVFASNENGRAHVKAFVRSLQSITPANGALLLLAHVDKASARSAGSTDNYSGSTGWNNSVRSRWSLRPAGDDAEEAQSARANGRQWLTVEKSNYGPAGARIELRWNDVAQMHVQDVNAAPVGGLAGAFAAMDADAWIIEAVRAAAARGDPVPSAMAGPRTAAHVLADLLGSPFRGRIGRKNCIAAINRLRTAGALSVGSQMGPDRHARGILKAPEPAGVPCGSSAGVLRECGSSEA